MITFHVLTLFPNIIDSYINESIIKRAQEKKLVSIKSYYLRDWATDKHKTVDDKIYGGAPGMLMKIDVLFKAISSIKKSVKHPETFEVWLTSPSGELFSQKTAKQASKSIDRNILIICGRYEGIDARIMQFIDKIYTVGPYVLTGGELPALIMIDAISRLIPGVLGNELSPEDETEFSISNDTISIKGEQPQYTRPEIFTFHKDEKEVTIKVPDILLSGHHKKIKEFEKQSKKGTKVTIA